MVKTFVILAHCVCATALLVSEPSWSDDFINNRKGVDQERALQSVRDGKIRPLAEILSQVSSTQPGNVLKVELEDHRGRLIYELKILTPTGQIVEIEIDAKSGNQILVAD